MTDQIARDLQNAATLLREMGWCQGIAHDRDGRHCLVGAIDAVAPDMMRRGDPLYREMQRHLGEAILAEWNDAPGRTAEEVISALEAAHSKAMASQGGGQSNG